MALALDGSVLGNVNGPSSITVSLTTTLSNDLIVVDIISNGGPIVSVNVASPPAGLSSFSFHGAAPESGAANDTVERWWATSTNPLSAVPIIVTMTTPTFTTVIAYGVNGANLLSPWDVGGPQILQAIPADPISITTHNANTMLVAAWSMQSVNDPLADTGFTTIQANSNFMLSEYQILTSSQTINCSIGAANGGTGNSKVGIADAIVVAAAAPSFKTIGIGGSNW